MALYFIFIFFFLVNFTKFVFQVNQDNSYTLLIVSDFSDQNGHFGCRFLMGIALDFFYDDYIQRI